MFCGSWVHPVPRIGYLQSQKGAGTHFFVVGRYGIRVQFRFDKRNLQHASMFHGMAGIDTEIHQHLIHLGCVGLNKTVGFRTFPFDFYPLRESGSEKLQTLINNRSKIAPRTRCFGLFAESEDLLYDLPGTVAGARYLLQLLPRLRVIGQKKRGDLAVPHYEREDIIEVMRHSRSEHPHQLHFLGQDDLLLQYDVLGLQFLVIGLHTQRIVQTRHEVFFQHRLVQQVSGAQVKSLAFQALIPQAREHNHLRIPGSSVGLDPGQQFQPVLSGHFDIEQGHVVAVLS